MTYQNELKFYSHKLHQEVLEYELKEEGFTLFACDQLVEQAVINNYELISKGEKTYENKQIKINAWSIDKAKENIDLIVCKYIDEINPKKIDESVIQNTSKSLANFLKFSLKDLSDNLKKSTELFDVAKTIKENKNKIKRIKLFVLTDGISKSDSIKSEKINNINISIEIIDLKKLFDMSTLGHTDSDIDLIFDGSHENKIECIGIENKTDDIKSFLAIIPGDILYQAYEFYGSKLMELNVRNFLQVTGSINTGIRKTIIEEPNMFFSYNNGIAVTAEEINFSSHNGKRYIKTLKGFQIVNGGQTTASIHRAKVVDNVNVENILVPTKITVIQKDKIRTIVPKISRFSNSQNSVKKSDFHSNNKYHKLIKELSDQIYIPGESGRWYFEIMRGDYQNDKFKSQANDERKRKFISMYPPTRKISKEEIAKYENGWSQKPDLVCKGAQNNFLEFMSSTANDLLEKEFVNKDYFKKLIAKAILCRSIEKIIKDMKIEGYKSHISAYLFSIISFISSGKFNLSLVWQDQSISNELHQTLYKWVVEVQKKLLNKIPNNVNQGEWFKRKEFWNEVKNIKLSFPTSFLIPEFAEVTVYKNSKIDLFKKDHLNNIKICKKIDSNKWLEINKWGQETEL